jgi:photosystem II stability/assembly factor-like uncharacterized protein
MKRDLARIGVRLLLGITFVMSVAACAGKAELAAIEVRLKGSSEGHILPQREDNYAVEITDTDNAWVVGTYGMILKIGGEGSKVTLIPSGTHSPLFCVSFNGPSNGLIGGERGLMIGTTDGGQHWEKVNLPPDVKDNNILAMARGKDRNQIWAIGPFGTVIHSADNGKTWESLGLKKDITLNDVTFFDDKEGWVSGEFGTILHTTDGGHTWQEQKDVSGLPKYTQEVTDDEARRRGIPRLEEEDLYLFQSVFTTPKNGLIVGAGGFILGTSDGGQHWQVIKTGTQNTLFSIALSGDHGGVSTGVLGTLVRGRNGAWSVDQQVSEHVFTWLRAVKFAPNGTYGLVAAGSGTILVTHDGGDRWEPISQELLAKAAG